MKSTDRSNLYFVLLLTAFLCGSFLLSLLMTSWFGTVDKAPHWLRMLLQYVLLFGGTSFAFMRKFGMAPKDAGFRLPKKPWIAFPVAILIAFLIQPLLVGISSLTEKLFPNPVATSMGSILADPLPLTLLGSALLPAIFEEWACRGILLFGYREKSSLLAAFVSALGFAILHMSLQQAPYAFCFGFVIAWIALLSESVYPAMLAHFLINATQLICAYYGVSVL